MNNSNASLRYWNPFKQTWVGIAYSDRITHPFYFKEVLCRGIDQIIKELNIPQYDIESSHGSVLWIFNGQLEDFKVQWQFENNTTPFSLKIGYYVDDNLVDIEVLYDYTTYEEVLDFIQAYMEKILSNGVPQEPEIEYDASNVAEVKLMHGVMQSMNNEDAYFSWIVTGVPDGATKDDYIDIALDEEEFEHCKQLFDSLFAEYAPDGLYRPSKDEEAYAKQTCKRLNLPEIEVLM